MWLECRFSVVQNTTLGSSPPGMRRRLPEEFVAVHDRHVPVEQNRLGHCALADFKRFRRRLQPRRSGSRDLRGCAVRLSDDAGVIDYKTCSRIRSPLAPDPEAMLRSRLDFHAAIGQTISRTRSTSRMTSELAVETVDAAGEASAMRGSRLTGFSSRPSSAQPQYFADLVDQQATGFAAQVDPDRHRRLAVVVVRAARAGRACRPR